MSVSRATGGAALVRQRLSGLVFLAVLAGLVGLSIAFYNKAFTDVVEVTLQADRAGNQLTPPADVKVDGVIVGEVRSVEATRDGARLQLALDPDRVGKIPSNVSARLLPKTLFGEKYVQLVRPQKAAAQPLAAGDVIGQDRTTTAVEFGAALDDLLPLLQTLQPEVLSTTLNAVSTSLRGRGERLGSNLVLARDYLREFNPELPRLERNLSGTADFADTLTATTPDLVAFLDDISAVNRNLVRDQGAIDRVLRETTGVAGTADRFVSANEQRFVDLAREGVPNLSLYAKYAPQFPCLAKGLSDSRLFVGDAFGTLQPGLHITLEIIDSRSGYQPTQDEPEYLSDRGPDCFGLPDPQVPAPDIDFQDGYQDQQPENQGRETYPGGARSVSGAAWERAALGRVLAPVLGVDTDAVPDVAQLLFAPVARGTAVGLSTSPAGPTTRSAS